MPSTGKRNHSRSKQEARVSGASAQTDESRGGEPPYADLFETTPMALALWELLYDEKGLPCDLRVHSANKLFREWFDVPEAMGSRASDIDPSYRERQPDILSIVSSVSSTGAVEKHEVFHPRLGRWLEFKASGAPQGLVLVYADDITERKAAETTLRRVQHSLDTTEDFPIWSDENGCIVDISQSSCRHLEYARDELLKMTLFDVYPDIDMEGWRASWREDFAPRSFQIETEYRTKSGQTVPVELSINSMVFDDERYHLAIARDASERKSAESALERLRYSLDHIDDYPAWTDPEGRIVEVSESTCRHLEYTREELLNMHVRDICPDIDLEDHAQSWVKGVDQKPFLIEVHHRTKSGRVYPVEIAVNPMVFGGKPYHCAFCRDISERISAEEALRESEELHRQLFELESDAIILADNTTGDVVEVNDAACELYGYTKNEFKSLRFSDLLAEPVELNTRNTPGEPKLIDRLHRRKDGTVFPAQRSIRYFTWKGQPMHVAAVRDVTEQKLAADELEESRRMLQSVLDTVPSRISWRGLDLRYLGCNSAAAADAALPDPADIVGLSHQDLPVHYTAVDQELDDREVIRSGRPRLGYEQKVIKTNGESQVLRSSKVPLRSRTGEVIGVLSIHDDITEQTETLNALRDRDEQLIQAQKMEAIGRLAGGIAHDFNNVLTTIVGYSDLILSSPDCPEGSVAEDITEIKDAAERAGALTQRILAFSRRQNLQPSLLSLNEVIADIEKLLSRTIGADIELTTSLAPELGKVEVDEHQFVQVLLNLAVNARDAMPKGGKLSIATADVELDEQFCETHPEVELGPYVMVTVADTGSGMDEEVLSHVFEPFYTTKPPGVGTGLGLATVYGIITQSSGCIYVHSRPERGTTFSIYLPRALEGSQPPESGKSDLEESGLGTIMVVDSDAPYLALTTRVLERRGFKVLPVSDGEKAAKMLADRSIKVTGLVTDLVLSGALQGEQLAELAARRRPGLRLLLVASDGSDAQTAAESSLSRASYLEKPFTAEELHREVRTWVTGPDSAGRGAG